MAWHYQLRVAERGQIQWRGGGGRDTKEGILYYQTDGLASSTWHPSQHIFFILDPQHNYKMDKNMLSSVVLVFLCVVLGTPA